MRSTSTMMAPSAEEPGARKKRIQVWAWLLAALAVCFYLGFIAWNIMIRSSVG